MKAKLKKKKNQDCPASYLVTFGIGNIKKYISPQTSNQDKKYIFDYIKVEREKPKTSVPRKKLQIRWNVSHRPGEDICNTVNKIYNGLFKINN